MAERHWCGCVPCCNEARVIGDSRRIPTVAKTTAHDHCVRRGQWKSGFNHFRIGETHPVLQRDESEEENEQQQQHEDEQQEEEQQDELQEDPPPLIDEEEEGGTNPIFDEPGACSVAFICSSVLRSHMHVVDQLYLERLALRQPGHDGGEPTSRFHRETYPDMEDIDEDAFFRVLRIAVQEVVKKAIELSTVETQVQGAI